MLLGLYRTSEYTITLWLRRIGEARTQATYKPGVYLCCYECTRAAGDVPDGNNTLWCFGKFLEPNATAMVTSIFTQKKYVHVPVSLQKSRKGFRQLHIFSRAKQPKTAASCEQPATGSQWFLYHRPFHCSQPPVHSQWSKTANNQHPMVLITASSPR